VFKQVKKCSNCIKGTAISVNGDILCREKGAVAPDFVCLGHKFNPNLCKENPTRNLCIDCKYFDVSNYVLSDTPSMGICKRYLVRPFDGKTKKSCSKFVKRINRDAI